ncbi:MAG: hydrogenase expression/formation protein HypE [Bryobacterales bacterium]|nr:hydrogenase expression/formation protein HypE [Bryobacterales bacterium]
MPTDFTLQCPVPTASDDTIVLAHGGGGKMSQRLFERVFLPAFQNEALAARHDGALIRVGGQSLAFTTDSYVVHPLEFPGGNIGDLAVNGTVNDLAMCGARPLYLTCGFILEEGLPVATLQRVVESMRVAAERAGVEMVSGDTKVVDRGKADGIFINTSGIGLVERAMSPALVEPGDAVIVSGELGAHGIAILSVREGLQFEAPIVSDTAPLWEPVNALIEAGIEVHCLRDLTRGGLASALNEIAQARGLGILVDETAVPVAEPVRGACEILGLDPLYVANEGRFVGFVSMEDADRAVRILESAGKCRKVSIAGRVLATADPTVLLRSRIGGMRILDMISGEQLPRIC